MSNYILVVNNNRFAVVSRSDFHLDPDDLFWDRLMNSEEHPDLDASLNLLLSRLRWIDLSDIVKQKTLMFDPLRVSYFVNCLGQRIVQFDVIEEMIYFLAYFELDEFDQIKENTLVGEVWRFEDILAVWIENYQQAVRRRCNFEIGSWQWCVWDLARRLVNQSQYDDADLLFECAIARAQASGEQSAVEEFYQLRDKLLSGA